MSHERRRLETRAAPPLDGPLDPRRPDVTADVTRADVAWPASSPYTEADGDGVRRNRPSLADDSCGLPLWREQEHAVPHRTTGSAGERRRRTRIGSVIRSQVTKLWRDLGFTLCHLTRSVASSADMSWARASTRRLVPVPTPGRSHQVPGRCAAHRAGPNPRQCSAVGHIDVPFPRQPLSPPRRSGAGGASTGRRSDG